MDEVWVPSEEGVVSLEPARGLTEEEWSEILRRTQEDPLVVEMIMTSMFGGVGVRLYSHPEFPGLPPSFLFTVTERMLPGQSLKAPSGGAASREAYQVFYDLASTAKNKAWVKDYKLRAPGGFVDYCY